MDYKEFLEKLQVIIRAMLPGEYDVKLNTVVKNNKQKKDAIVIRNSSSRMVPSIYLKQYYESLSKGRILIDIANEIVRRALNNQKDNEVDSEISEIHSVSDKIVFRLINRYMNRERLEEVPHVVIEDMAKVYYIVVRADFEGVSSIAVTNELLQRWEVNIECIDRLAYENTPCIFPGTIKSLKEIMKDMLFNRYDELSGLGPSGDDKEMYDQFLSVILDTSTSSNNEEMYVLSNNKGINGASALLYPDLLHSFAKEHQTNLYILPSSIHEVILIPAHKKFSRGTLREMVIDVNCTQVAIEEVLSNEVYYYDLRTNEFHIAKDE